jgi:hypothetical protein
MRASTDLVPTSARAYLETSGTVTRKDQSNPVIMTNHFLTTSIRTYAPIRRVLWGDVRPGTRIFGDSVAGGRAPD